MTIIEKSTIRHHFTALERFTRAAETLERPAQTRTCDGSTAAQRTAARFELLAQYAAEQLNSDQRDYVRGAFEHAFRHDDVAAVLYEKVRGTSLDFSQPLRVTKPAVRKHDPAARADAERKRVERDEKNRRFRAETRGGHGSSGKQQGKGKK